MDSGNVYDPLGQGLKIVRFQTKGADRITAVSVEACAENNKLWSVLCRKSFERRGKMLEIFLARCLLRQGNIARGAESPSAAGFIATSRSRVKRPSVD